MKISRGFLFQAIEFHRIKDKLTKEKVLIWEEGVVFYSPSSWSSGPSRYAEVWTIGLLPSINRRGDKNLKGRSVFVEVNDGKGVEGIFQIRLLPGKQWSITRSPLYMTYFPCWSLGGERSSSLCLSCSSSFLKQLTDWWKRWPTFIFRKVLSYGASHTISGVSYFN